MTSVADLVEPDRLLKLATLSNLRLGREIAAAGTIEMLDFGPLVVRAKVGGPKANSQRRTTELRSVNGTLEWSCSCSRKGQFCKHCAALAIATWENSPKRRRQP
jgi:uncharacterized Zn finger protein